VVIPPEEEDAWERQCRIIERMPMARRWELAEQLIHEGLRQRRERLSRHFPHTDAAGLRWAMVREALGCEPGTEPLPR
jgi:hypothetical protein